MLCSSFWRISRSICTGSRRELLSLGGDIQEEGEAIRLSSAAQWPAVLRAFQRYCHQVVLSQFIYFCDCLTSKQKQSDNKIRLRHVETTTLLWKTCTYIFFYLMCQWNPELDNSNGNSGNACLPACYLFTYLFWQVSRGDCCFGRGESEKRMG